MTEHSAASLLEKMSERGYFLAIAESLTGGLLTSEFVSIPGASKVLLGSVTAYQNSIKQNLLAVPSIVLENYGAVSAEVAEAMAIGVRAHFAAAAGIPLDQVIGIATTGVAGPDAEAGKPIGLVYLGFSLPNLKNLTKKLELAGTRSEIRQNAVRSALSELGEQIGK
jgi:nicotinamide-nucleotide amidase